MHTFHCEEDEQVVSLVNSPVFGGDSCARCLAGLEVGKFVAMAAPELGPALAVALCVYFDFESDCYTEYSVLTLGAVVTQVVANADVGGFDGQVRTVPVAAHRAPAPGPATMRTGSLMTDRPADALQ